MDIYFMKKTVADKNIINIIKIMTLKDIKFLFHCNKFQLSQN
jgi:hypothetical protein